MENCHLLMVLQTHSVGSSLEYQENRKIDRFVKEPKSEVMRRCVKSFIKSANYAKKLLPNADFKLVVLDDHSDAKSLKHLKEQLSLANFNTQLINLETKGIMPSILQCYKYGADNGKELVYFVQDDYLYRENAIYEMISALYDFSDNTNTPVSIYPFDDPLRYTPENISIPCNIVRYKNRHWRSQIMTASCFLTHVSVIKLNWDLFEAMGKSKFGARQEDRTINQLFRSRHYRLFVPIPSLAFHMQYECHVDDTTDWKTLWDENSK